MLNTKAAPGNRGGFCLFSGTVFRRWPALVWLFLLAACTPAPLQFEPVPVNSVVLVIGDSLVAGTGASRAESWPRRLAERTGWRVINAGIPGNTSTNALQRLPALLDRHRPAAVIIAVGGNDFLRRVPKAVTRARLQEMITRSRAVTSHVALMAVPTPGLAASLGMAEDHEMFAELAEANGLALIPGAIITVLSDPILRADAIHANAAGYALMAELVAEALDRHGWLPPD